MQQRNCFWQALLILLLFCLGGCTGFQSSFKAHKVGAARDGLPVPGQAQMLPADISAGKPLEKLTPELSHRLEAFARQVTEHLLDARASGYENSQAKLALEGEKSELSNDLIQFLSEEGYIAKSMAELRATAFKLRENKSSSTCKIAELKVKDPDQRGLVPVEIGGKLCTHDNQRQATDRNFRFRYLVQVNDSGNPPAGMVLTNFEDLSDWDILATDLFGDGEEQCRKAKNLQSRTAEAANTELGSSLTLLTAFQQIEDFCRRVDTHIRSIYRRNYALACALSMDNAFKQAFLAKDKSTLARIIKSKLGLAGFTGYARIMSGSESEFLFSSDAATKEGSSPDRSAWELVFTSLKRTRTQEPSRLSQHGKSPDQIPGSLCRLAKTGSFGLCVFAPIQVNGQLSGALALGQPFDSELLLGMCRKVKQQKASPKEIMLTASTGGKSEISASSVDLKSNPALTLSLEQSRKDFAEDKSPVTISGNYLWKQFPVFSSGGLPANGQIFACISLSPRQRRLAEAPHRSRLLDMALTRAEQMQDEPLCSEDLFMLDRPGLNKAASRAKGEAPGAFPRTSNLLESNSKAALDSPDTSAATSGLETKMQSENPGAGRLLSLATTLQKQKTPAAQDHSFTIQQAIDLSLALEGMHADGQYAALSASRKWQQLAARLESCAAAHKPARGSFPDPEELSRLERLSKWMHNSGEILALILWGHQRNQDALDLARQIRTVDCLANAPAAGPMVSATNLHRLLSLARLFTSQNAYAEAKETILAAKNMASKLPTAGMNNRRALALCFLEESMLSSGKGDFTAAAEQAGLARDNFERSLERNQSREGKAMEAEILEQLARSLAMSPNKIKEAIENQEKCLDIRQQCFGKDGIASVSTELDLSRFLRRQLSSERTGSPADPGSARTRRIRTMLEEIIAVCNRSEAYTEVLRSDRNPSLLLPQAYFELGNLLGTCANFKEARSYFKKACDIHLSFKEPRFIPDKVTDLDALASLDLHDGKVDEARAKVLQSSGFLNTYVTDVLPQLSLAEQIAFCINIETHMNALLAVCRDDAALSGPYADLMRWKGFVIEQFRLRSMAIKTGGNEMSKLVKGHEKLSEKLLSTLVQSARSGSAPGFEASQCQSRKEELERQINAQARAQFRQSTNLVLTPRNLQAQLNSGEALVDLYEFAACPWQIQARYGAVICSAGQLRWVDLGPAVAINAAVDSWRESGIRTALPQATDRQSDFGPQTGDGDDPWLQLQKLLSDPLEEKISPSAKHVWISDECQLSRIPWSILLPKYGSSKDYEVCLIDSPRELLTLKRHQAKGRAQNKMLLVGGIDFSKHVPAAPPLKNAVTEVRQLQQEAEGHHLKCVVLSDLLDKSKAHPTRENVMDELPKCSFVHIVTHGFFSNTDSDPDSSDRSGTLGIATRSLGAATASQMLVRNPLIGSGLLVSKFQTGKASPKSGFLTAEDLLDANLEGCRLVTLSACETGRGRELSSQGIMGLRSALMGAGADAVLLSLWPVPDAATSELMKVFYQELFKGEPPSSALKKAQNTVRSQYRFRAPRNWAAWVIVGDGWKKLSVRN